MTIWERHAERMRRQQKIVHRQEQLERFDRWCKTHPWRARFMLIGITIAVGEIAMLLRFAIDKLQ